MTQFTTIKGIKCVAVNVSERTYETVNLGWTRSCGLCPFSDSWACMAEGGNCHGGLDSDHVWMPVIQYARLQVGAKVTTHQQGEPHA